MEFTRTKAPLPCGAGRPICWVSRELKKEYGGLKGAWNWLLGRGLPTGMKLYSKMVDEADDMIMAMEEGREVDILQEVMRYWGMEAGER